MFLDIHDNRIIKFTLRFIFLIAITCFVSKAENGEISFETSGVDNWRKISEQMIELGRRVKSLEQNVWQISGENMRWRNCMKGPCTCNPPSLSVSCWNLALGQIPEAQTISTNTRILDLGGNLLSSLHRNTFKGLTELIQLDLSNNQLDHLPSTIFNDLGDLKYLLLQRNSLDSLSHSIFQKLKALNTLDLSENRISTLPPHIWNGVAGSLKTLQLSFNKLSSFSNFDNLRAMEDLDLTGNCIKYLQSFKTLVNLKNLKLGQNNLTSISDTTFDRLYKLEKLNLQRNQLEELPPNAFKHLKNLASLDLSSNGIYEISRENFVGLTSLLKLDLSKNYIMAVKSSTFVDLPALNDLSLQSNIIEEIEGLEGISNLTTLNLERNLIPEIKLNFFTHMQNLSLIYLAGNGIHTVEEDSLEALLNLRSLSFKDNNLNCTCEVMYFSNWVKDHQRILDEVPNCYDPEPLIGVAVTSLTFQEICPNHSS